MRRWMIVTASAALAVGLATAGLRNTVQAPTVPSAHQTVPYRIVGEWQGRVAVFIPGDPVPETVYDTATTSLPTDIRQALQKGVETSDASTLKILLDDLLS